VSDVLIDTSAWIDFFRGTREAVRHIDPLIADDRAGINGVVYAEVLSGARDRPHFMRLRRTFRALGWVEEPAGIWDQVAEARFALARTGFQAAIADLLIAISALQAGHSLLARDRDFERIRAIVPVDLAVF
jgi:predicted nucleic acid-binding protein